jgi:hypothetical protein
LEKEELIALGNKRIQNMYLTLSLMSKKEEFCSLWSESIQKM